MTIETVNSEEIHESDDEASSSFTDTSITHYPEKHSSENKELAADETKAVFLSRFILVAIVTLAAASVALVTYYSSTRQEEDLFEAQFRELSQEILKNANFEAETMFAAMDTFSTSATSFALATNHSWPEVTIPDFEIRGGQVNALSTGLVLVLSPLVEYDQREEWQKYAMKNQGWIPEGLERRGEEVNDEDGNFISPGIYRFFEGITDVPVKENSPGPFLPIWQIAPAPKDKNYVNYNLLSRPIISQALERMRESRVPIMSELTSFQFLYQHSPLATDDDIQHPHTLLIYPIYKDFDDNKNTLVAMVTTVLAWDNYFQTLLPEGAHEITVEMDNSCGDVFTYRINGDGAYFQGYDSLHDSGYDHMEETAPFTSQNAGQLCEYVLHIFPSNEMEDYFTTRQPITFTTGVSLVFVMTALVFIFYDYLVSRRQIKLMSIANRSAAIVSSIFPSNVRDRIMRPEEPEGDGMDMSSRQGSFFGALPKNQLKGFLEEGELKVLGSKPIADFFPEATILFADIVGFTAWSSVREPTQVFQLLETLFHAFDEIAKVRRVFKVETVGDCYVAVCGLPEPRRVHAVVMARFARDVLTAMNDLVKKLELTLGPDTGELSLRIGLHSGPVTAGVLRGEKSRFQLFGDSVNTAARMESNGERNRIQLSSETARLLGEAGKSSWIQPRKELITAKGKGELQTYWLIMKQQAMLSMSDSGSDSRYFEVPQEMSRDKRKEAFENEFQSKRKSSKDNSESFEKVQNRRFSKKALGSSTKSQRLIYWNVDVLARLLRGILARRLTTGKGKARAQPGLRLPRRTLKGTVLDEVKEIIKLPAYKPGEISEPDDINEMELDALVLKQLHDYISIIASMYRDVPFHNFEHASHVTMSVVKLLSRIVVPDVVLEKTEFDSDERVIKNMHDHTYGITSDPLTQFAVVFSALIHDVDHTGVSNATLVEERAAIAVMYNNKSVAEQNSVDIAWELLMEENFDELRGAIYSTREEMQRFRQLIVNSVLATDICDKELKELRNKRWDRAFYDKESEADFETVAAGVQQRDTNRKATIVIEHLIQASDISHTMQHWHIYRKWNERFYEENLRAYKAGRVQKHPSEYWYNGEIGFFDFYIIPLAKKLKECGVFGVSSDEYLNYALHNRAEWERKGEKVVQEYKEKYEKGTQGGERNSRTKGNLRQQEMI